MIPVRTDNENPQALYELMAEHPIMLRGIIKILCERLRETHTKRDVETAPTTF